MENSLINLILTGAIGAMVAIVCVMCGAIITDYRVESFKKEAIKNGFAEWVVDSDGCTEFQWKVDSQQNSG